MGMNPLKEKGTPLEKQVRSWNELNSKPYNRNEVHPYTRSRIMLMNGLETHQALFSHYLLRHNDNPEIREKITLLRRIELQQQKLINWLIPPEESLIEQALGYEQAEVDLTAWLARTEPDTYVKSALNYGLLEDLDHLYRFANLYDISENGDAEKIVGDLTEVLPGRPTADQHQFPFDTIRRSVPLQKTNILSKLHLVTMDSLEQQTMMFYMNAGNRISSPLGRGLFQEIAMAEEQHLTQYGSLNEPGPSAMETFLLHQYNECYLYHSCLESETDSRVKNIWAQMLENEIEHVKTAAFLMQKAEGRDPESVVPSKIPKLTIFDSNKEYIRAVLSEQVELTALGEKYLPYSKLQADSQLHSYQKRVNSEGYIPSMQVVGENIRRNGQDYRIESRGPHPLEGMRERNSVQRVMKNLF
ncbi:MAG: hypothetical protein ACLFVQ_00680 [Chitinispirillaceae bacterium]